MAVAIEAAKQTVQEQLAATIIPMQRAVENLQAEFAALRDLPGSDGDAVMLSASKPRAMAVVLALQEETDPKRARSSS